LLLLHKLQVWDDRRKAEEAHQRAKRLQDTADMKRLMALKMQTRMAADVG